MGDVMGTWTRSGRGLGMTPQDGMSEIDATAPLAEMQRLTDLRSITGTGVPDGIQPLRRGAGPRDQGIITAKKEKESWQQRQRAGCCSDRLIIRGEVV